MLDYKEKIETEHILTSNLQNNQSSSSSSFSFTSDQYEHVSVNLEIVEESSSDEVDSVTKTRKTRKTRVYKYWTHIETLES